MVGRAMGMLTQAGTAGDAYGPMPGALDLNKGFTISPGDAIPPELDTGGSGLRSLLSGRGPHPVVVFLIFATVALALLMHEKAFLRGSASVGLGR